jgi:aerobic-type carbon monoxide dehydrogenase small subunit (CoxS/CutS family)
MITLHVNGADRVVDAPAEMPLLWALRDVLGLTMPHATPEDAPGKDVAKLRAGG